MIDIGYYNGTDSYHGLRLRCAGHIFAAPGRRIDRPAGREDWLLFYVAAGSETFFLPQGEQTAEAGKEEENADIYEVLRGYDKLDDENKRRFERIIAAEREKRE